MSLVLLSLAASSAIACTPDDLDACTAAVDRARRAWVGSVFAGQEDRRQIWALGRYAEVGCAAGSPVMCRWARANQPRGVPDFGACGPERADACPLPTARIERSEPTWRQAIAHGNGWLGFENGRFWPGGRAAPIIEGATRAFVFEDQAWFFSRSHPRGAHHPVAFSIYDSQGWRDVPIRVPEGRYFESAGRGDADGLLVLLGCDGCQNRAGLLHPDGRVELPDEDRDIIDVAGGWLLARDPETGELHRRSPDGAWDATNRAKKYGNYADIAPTGQVLLTTEEGMALWSVDGVFVPVPLVSGGADWADGHWWVAAFLKGREGMVSKVTPEGEVLQTWAIGGRHTSLRVHPDGRSLITAPGGPDASLVSLHGAPVWTEVPSWLAEAPRHRAPVHHQVAEGPVATLVDPDGKPVSDAWVEGQFTDADGHFRAGAFAERPYPARCSVRLHGSCWDSRYDVDAAELRLEPAVVAQFADDAVREVRAGYRELQVIPYLGDHRSRVLLGPWTGEGRLQTVAPPEPVYTGVREEGGEVTWTAHPATRLQLVDEVGHPLAGQPVASSFDGLSFEVKSDANGIVGVRHVDDGELTSIIKGVTFRRDGDRLVSEREVPLAVPEQAPASVSLVGAWRTVGPEESRIWVYEPAPDDEVTWLGGVAQVNGRWVAALSPDRVAIARYVNQAHERLVPGPRSTAKRFSGHFGWEAGDRATVETVELESGRRVMVEALSVHDDAAGLRVQHAVEALEWPETRRLQAFSMTSWLTHPRQVQVTDGWFVGVPGDPYADVTATTNQLNGPVLQVFLGMRPSRHSWPSVGRLRWWRDVGMFVNRTLALGETVTETHSLPGEKDLTVTLTFVGREKCPQGKCARFQQTMAQAGRSLVREVWLYTDALRPYRVIEPVGSVLYQRTWTWE